MAEEEAKISGDAVKKEAKRRSGKKRKDMCPYGNYKGYYGYRIGNNAKEDPRFLAFEKKWFMSKDCLDIGCNQGLITVDIANKYSCRSMLGIDIDGELIGAANWYLRKVAKMETTSSRPTKRVISNGVDEGLEHTQQSGQVSCENLPVRNSSRGGENLLDRVSFKQENFVQKMDNCEEKYDTILCLSVTKWIHLNWGDEGLITLFVKIWRLLRQGGILLLEPQPWKSYIRNHRVSLAARENFSRILFTPDCFEEILLDKVGFRSVQKVTGKLQGTVAGFERPIFAFTK